MPKFNVGDCPEMENVKVNNNYSFSAVKIDDLGSTEQTIVTVVVDKSGSWYSLPFMEKYDKDYQEKNYKFQGVPKLYDFLKQNVEVMKNLETELQEFVV